MSSHTKRQAMTRQNKKRRYLTWKLGVLTVDLRNEQVARLLASSYEERLERSVNTEYLKHAIEELTDELARMGKEEQR